MSIASSSYQRQGMAAQGQDPWLGVHVLAQFSVCPRAGQIAYEKNQLDTGENDAPPSNRARRFSWRQTYLTVAMIERDLRRANRIVARLVTVLVALIVAAAVLYLAGLRLVSLACALPCPFVLAFMPEAFRRSRALGSLHRRARTTRPARPQPGFDKSAPVDWWALLASGFEVRPSADEPLRDPRWRLAGSPWRVLIDGDLRIPVFLCRKTAGANARRLFGNDYLRMAAYCHLIEVSEGSRSPFGIILYPDDYTGVAIANGPYARSIFHNELRRAREALVSKRDPGQARAGSRVCTGCEFGKPFALGGFTPPGTIRLNVLSHPAVGQDGRSYHSECGDRYRWLPPHAKAAQKRLSL